MTDDHMAHVIIIEDDPTYAQWFKDNLSAEGLSVDIALSANEGLRLLAESYYDLVVTDIKMPGTSGIDLMARIRKGEEGIDADIPIVALTSVNDVKTAVEAMRLGAQDYITKESEKSEIIIRVKNALARSRIINENRYLKETIRKSSEFADIVGESPAIKKIKAAIAESAPKEVTVLITGETGVGKELVARAIHQFGYSKKGPFIDINCASLPDENLFQSELFGHEKGSFTGAIEQKRGKFEIAANGSVFLDEVGDMSLDSQAKILKAIEQGVISRIGGNRAIRLSCRFIFASNKDLEKEMDAGRFRSDLYYRINVYPIHISPLRARKEDTTALAQYFVDIYCRKYGKSQKQLAPDALEVLTSYSWPGNVRELRNIVERIIIRVSGESITARDVETAGIPSQKESILQISIPDEGINLRELEKNLVMEALQKCGWKQKKAAALLGISPDRMNTRVKKFGITHPSWRVHKNKE